MNLEFDLLLTVVIFLLGIVFGLFISVILIQIL
jgi:hypothetical protein